MTVRETNPTQYDLALQRGTEAIQGRWFRNLQAKWQPAIDAWNARHPVGSKVRSVNGHVWTVQSGARLRWDAPWVGPMFRVSLVYVSSELPIDTVDESWTQPETQEPGPLERVGQERRPWWARVWRSIRRGF